MNNRMDETIGATVRPEQAAARAWDVVVIGAGPAGAVAAALLARRGLAVLLVERQALPREKVCGGCVSAAAEESLRSAGIDTGGLSAGAPRLRRTIVLDRGRRLTAALPGGFAISRRRLDGHLVRHALDAGAELLTEASAVGTATASMGGQRLVWVRPAGREPVEIAASVVIVASGLAGRIGGDLARLAVQIRPASRIGLNAVTCRGARFAGDVVMVCGRRGYVGMTALEKGNLNIAAALDPGFVRGVGGPEAAVRAIFKEAGAPAPEIAGLTWSGTPPLARRVPRISLPRLLLIGDAAGYVEPFTGEGIAWAVSGAAAAAPLAEAGVADWNAELEAEWAQRHRDLIESRQRLCRMIAWSVRRPSVRWAAITAGRAVPGIAGAVASRLHRPYNLVGVTPPLASSPAVSAASS